MHCESFTMHPVVASSIPCKLSLCADREQARAGDSHASSGIDVGCPTTQNVLAIAPPHEFHQYSWPSSSTGTSSFCCNHQYSVTAITTSAGAIAERYAYTAYGQPTILDASASVLSSSAINNRYTYTGREWDATLGLHHFRARWMSPSAGRFLTRDPIGYEGSEWSLCEFIDGRAFAATDPAGTLSIPVIVNLVGGVGCYACGLFMYSDINTCKNGCPCANEHGLDPRTRCGACVQRCREANWARLSFVQANSMRCACVACVIVIMYDGHVLFG